MHTHRWQVKDSRHGLAGHVELARNTHACCAGLSNNYLRVGEMAERMKNNLDKDHQLVRRFIGGIVHQVMPVTAPFTLTQQCCCMRDKIRMCQWHCRKGGWCPLAVLCSLLSMPNGCSAVKACM